MRRSILTILFAAIAGVLAACQPTEPVKNAPDNAPSPTAPSSPAAVPAVSPGASVDPKAPVAPAGKVASLEGLWPGVEGTSLNVVKNGEKYKIEIKNLDKTETFEGIAKGDTIEFKRKDKMETIKAATAEETGMKWLAGEKNCVVITKGSEGYCRK